MKQTNKPKLTQGRYFRPFTAFPKMDELLSEEAFCRSIFHDSYQLTFRMKKLSTRPPADLDTL